MTDSFLYYVGIGGFLAVIFGILVGRITTSKPKAMTIADLEDQAILEIKDKFWSKDIGHHEFGQLCEEIRAEYWADKDKLEKRIIRKSKVKK